MVLALVGLSFLLTVKSRPRVEWLYGAVGSPWGGLLTFAWLAHGPRIGLIAVATIAAFGLWALGRVDPAAQAFALPAAGIESARL